MASQPEQNPISAVLPNYRETFGQISQHVKDRSSTLKKRVLWLFVPTLVVYLFMFIAAYYFISIANRSGQGDVLSRESLRLITIGFGVVAATVAYYAIFSSIFFLEKLIWLDAEYDQKPLTSNDSWRIAKKLFWQAQLVRLSVFFRYVVPAIIITIALWYALTKLGTRFKGDVSIYFFFFSNIVLAVGVAFSVYLLKIKLKFLWFVFLDQYARPDYSIGGLLKEIALLNDVDAKKVRSKSALLLVLEEMMNATGGGSIGRQSAIAILKEPLRQVGAFGKLAAMYMLYRHVGSVAYGKEQFVNEALYKL